MYIVTRCYIFQLKYFHDPVVSCIQRLDVIDLLETVQQQMEVYTNLVQVIPNIPKVNMVILLLQITQGILPSACKGPQESVFKLKR